MIVLIKTADYLEIGIGCFQETISAKSIERNFEALSHFPERRARAEIDTLFARLSDFKEFIERLATQRDIAADFDALAEAERYVRKSVSLARAYWASESRCMSWHITGPARFPVDRNRKRIDISAKRASEWQEHTISARKAIRRAAYPHGEEGDPIRSDDPEAIKKIEAKIAALGMAADRAVLINAAVRKLERAGKTQEEMVDALVADLGVSRTLAISTCIIPERDKGWRRRHIETALTRAEIKRLQDRLGGLKRMAARGDSERTVQTAEGNVEVVENAEAARIQLIFPGKPSGDVRDVLKREGFRWSPSHGAWQRHLNSSGRDAVRRVLDILRPEEEKA